MNCAAFEQLIALDVEGDIPQSERMRVAGHIETCANCRHLADELKESQSVFKDLRQQTVHSIDLLEVRQRVMGEVGDLEPVPAWVLMMHRLVFAGLRRRTAIAGVVLAALVSGGVWYEHARVIAVRLGESPVQVARIIPAPPEVLPEVPQRSAVISRIVRRVDPSEPVVAVLPEEAPVPSIDVPPPQESPISQIPMKFVTDDPDIIIYWLPMDKGD